MEKVEKGFKEKKNLSTLKITCKKTDIEKCRIIQDIYLA